MSSDRPLRRVIAVAPMPPEKSAYALARYSRSPDSIENSIKWVHGHSSEKFWEQFYFDYGHASIADLGHVIICFEEITELAAIRLEDEPVWDGQAKSSRYQNFASGGWYVPDTIHGSETEGTDQGILRSLGEIYRLLHGPLVTFLSEREPRPESHPCRSPRRRSDGRRRSSARAPPRRLPPGPRRGGTPPRVDRARRRAGRRARAALACWHRAARRTPPPSRARCSG